MTPPGVPVPEPSCSSYKNSLVSLEPPTRSSMLLWQEYQRVEDRGAEWPQQEESEENDDEPLQRLHVDADGR